MFFFLEIGHLVVCNKSYELYITIMYASYERELAFLQLLREYFVQTVVHARRTAYPHLTQTLTVDFLRKKSLESAVGRIQTVPLHQLVLGMLLHLEYEFEAA